DEQGERVPVSVAGWDREKGTVTVMVQAAGRTTKMLHTVEQGDFISDFAGPLGKATEMEGLKKVCVVGGGVGCAIALPVAEEFHRLGAEVTSIIGFRSVDLLILEDEFKACSDRLIVMSDDGSYGRHGNVTVPLKEMLEAGEKFDLVIAIGPGVMMKFTVLTCKPFGVPCRVSMNPIMIDGTGMCGGCRLTLIQDGKRVTKFACVDGPEFDGYEIDFDEAMSRGRMYFDYEQHAYHEACNLLKQG
ncbi:MAG: sulfide/dihydroorotate dehydrogenase-like FAD/NAD-binding protein, partial [Lachnospiraceae bacterium]|nr:sulfide/dihydroorotate dehydrogenase-like FAD/NAD-binding protein [Lachnospiraceae bacterium]